MSSFAPNKKKLSASLRPSTAPTPTSSSSSQTPTPTSPGFHLSSSLNSNPHVRLQSQLPATQPVPSRFKTLSHSASSPSLNSIANPSSVPILQWTLTDVSTFLSSVKCGHLASAFESNDITGEVILELGASHLKEMGIDRVGDRVRMLSALKGLKKTAAAESAGLRQSSMRGPRVVVTGGEDELDGLSMSYSIERGGENGLYRPNGNGMLSHPPITIFATPPLSSVETFANANKDTPRGRALYNRPAPLDISSAQPAADPRLPQAYQPEPPRHESSPHSSPSQYKTSSSSSSIRSARTPCAPSSHPPPPSGPPPSGPLPPVRAPSPSNAVTPTVSAHSSRAAREASLRPPGGHAPSASLSLNTNRRPTATTGIPTSYSSSSLSTSSSAPFPAFGTSSLTSGRPSTGTTGGSFTERRALLAKEREARAGSSSRPSTSQGLSSPVGSSSTAPRSLNTNLSASQGASPALGVNGRPVQGQTSSHPFATATPGTPSSPLYPPLSSSIPINNPGQTASASPFSSTPNPPPSAPGSSAFATGRNPYQNSANSSSSHQLSLDELRRKTIKFINAEDGHSRVVNLTDCQGGLEVMEVVLRKFGKWNGGGFEIETESEDDLDGKSPKRGLCVDGWGVFIDGYGEGGASVPLTEAELLSICHAPPDSPSRERGLILKRTRKLPNRKHIEAFFGETPPAPNSPTSPTYYAGPRLGVNDDAGDLHSMLHPPSTPLSGLRDFRNSSNVGAKKMNRASTVSVMSGLGVPAPSFVESYMSHDSFSSGRSPYLSAGPGESTHSPPTQPDSTTQTNRSPSAGSFLVNRGRKMYNFFGHRPPSELISNHLAEYFPSAKKKVLERTARNSTMRLGSGAPGMGESASLNMLQAGNGSGGLPGTSWSDEKLNPSSRLSMSSLSGVGSPRKKRNSSIGGRKSSDSGKRNGHQNSNLRAMSPPRTAIPEDPNGERTASIEVPRLSFSTDGGETLAYLDQPSSPQPNDFTDEKPPLLPPFASSTESLLDSFKKYSPESSSTTLDAPAPRLGAGGRRVSNASNSRLSMISQIRRSKDRSDTASMLTVDEITAHVESKRTSMIGGESDDGTEEFDELRNLALGARRPSRSETIRTFGAGGTGIQGSQDGDDEDEEDDGTEDGEEYESEEESDEEDYSEEEESEDDDEEDEEEEVVETAEDEHGKAFMSTGGERSIKWIKGALIGSGSFGSVFLGMDAQNGLLMAVKQVEIPTGVSVNEERKKSMLSALEREIELLKELQHDNIVQYLDSSTDAAHLNIFLEYVPGGSVSALLGNYGAFEEALVRTFVRQTLQGLAYLHDREIIHRDIKGANILVDNKGGIKISDFGISKKVESNLLATTHQRQSLQGTVFWMAPEVVRQTAHTRQADIWSVGCLVIEMLTGQRPWGALDQMQVMFRIGSSGKPDFPPDITTDAEDFLNKTLELDHIKRPSAAECLSHPFIIQNLAPTL